MKNFLLVILALVLMVVILPITFLYTIVRLFVVKGMYRELDQWAFTIAKSLDQLGGVLGKFLFNDWLVKPGGARFGDEDELMSSVFGKNKKENKLYFFGKVIAWILNAIDPNHVEDSIEE